MTRLWAITKREYASFFRVPLGWVVAALTLLISGAVFSLSTLSPGEPATMRWFFAPWWWLLPIVAPAVSMRLVSEEIRTGTIEGLLTSPLAEGTIVAGKYLGAVLFLVTAAAPTLVYVAVLEGLSRPDFGPIVSGYLGLLLLAMFHLAVGTLLSTLTASQTLAYLGTLFVLLALVALDAFAGRLSEMMPPTLRDLPFALSISRRTGDFAKGLIDGTHVVFFVAADVWLLTLAALCLRARRWR